MTARRHRASSLKSETTVVSLIGVELVVPTPQDKPRFLASTEYLIHFGLSSHKRFPLIKRDPRWQTKSSSPTTVGLNSDGSGMDVTVSNSSTNGAIVSTNGDIVKEVLLLEPTSQKRPRYLASFTYIF